MLGVHFLERAEGSGGLGISFERLDDDPEGDFCVVVDPSVAAAAKIAFGFLAVAYALHNPITPLVFGVSLAIGYFLRHSFQWIIDEIVAIWRAPTHYHDNEEPCRDRQVMLGLASLAVTAIAPFITAAYAGLYMGTLANEFVSHDESACDALNEDLEIADSDRDIFCTSHENGSLNLIGDPATLKTDSQ